ncbi:uncharacterized protein Dmoj_GI26134, isoform B [Drosophila mojavensis]|uniref:Uncharacterized protein, isoform B n=1 Tax=Drosophila mojavensis TaxID=7230 RepID=A0A0Q9XFZ4_DROMO|nr:uncharacterized protein Dmoj_GI26134, isoform B [Drosophila mojavensis]
MVLRKLSSGSEGSSLVGTVRKISCDCYWSICNTPRRPHARERRVNIPNGKDSENRE